MNFTICRSKRRSYRCHRTSWLSAISRQLSVNPTATKGVSSRAKRGTLVLLPRIQNAGTNQSCSTA